jgi:cob(I)alamin adenosyltransferase
MLEQLKSIIKQMGQGLSYQYLGEMLSSSSKIDEIEKRCHDYNASGGRSRIVLLAGTELMNTALDFVIELARNTDSLIEILYFKQEQETMTKLSALMNRLSDLTQDFQITFVTADIGATVSSYHKQRQDIMAVVSSASEPFLEDLRSARPEPHAVSNGCFPDILIIGSSISA